MRPGHRCGAWYVALVVSASAACARTGEPDAYGNVEATEVIVGAQASGQLLSFTAKEGERLAASAVVGAIDAAELELERDQLAATRQAHASRVNEVAQQIEVLQARRNATAAQREAAVAQRAALEAQHQIARRAYERAERLYRQQATTAQQLDQAEKEFRVLDQQLKAQDDQIAAHTHQVAAEAEQIEATRAERDSATKQLASYDAQVARVGERVRKSQVTNPIAGTVLATYAKAGEIVQPGQALYKIADLETVDVRAYVTEPQLAQVRLGSAVQVSVDAGKDARRVLPGTVSWVSSQAEFTPTPIQTREERADLVYAIKVRVGNRDGALKIGMPADVRFVAPEASP